MPRVAAMPRPPSAQSCERDQPFTELLGSRRGGNHNDELDATAPSRVARERLTQLLNKACGASWEEALTTARELPLAAPLRDELLAGLADQLTATVLADEGYSARVFFILEDTGAITTGDVATVEGLLSPTDRQRFYQCSRRRLLLPLRALAVTDDRLHDIGVELAMDFCEQAFFDAVADFCVELIRRDENRVIEYAIAHDINDGEHTKGIFNVIVGDGLGYAGMLDEADWTVAVAECLMLIRGFNHKEYTVCKYSTQVCLLLRDAAHRLVGERDYQMRPEDEHLPVHVTPPRGLHGRARTQQAKLRRSVLASLASIVWEEHEDKVSAQ